MAAPSVKPALPHRLFGVGFLAFPRAADLTDFDEMITAALLAPAHDEHGVHRKPSVAEMHDMPHAVQHLGQPLHRDVE